MQNRGMLLLIGEGGRAFVLMTIEDNAFDAKVLGDSSLLPSVSYDNKRCNRLQIFTVSKDMTVLTHSRRECNDFQIDGM